MFKKYYLLHVSINGTLANVYIDRDYCQWLADKNRKQKITLLNKWRISRRQFNALKNEGIEANE